MASDTQIELVDANGDGLFVVCDWHDDRFVHTIGIVANGNKIPMLRSVEDDPDQIWPCSPPLQQISQQLIDGSPALLGLGMAGKSHYSTSFLLTETDGQFQLLIESACSIHDDVQRDQADQVSLRSSYQTVADVRQAPGSADSNSVVLYHQRTDDRTLPGIMVEALRGKLTSDSELNTANSGTASLQISPADSVPVKTTQWSYRLQLAVNDVSTGV